MPFTLHSRDWLLVQKAFTSVGKPFRVHERTTFGSPVVAAVVRGDTTDSPAAAGGWSLAAWEAVGKRPSPILTGRVPCVVAPQHWGTSACFRFRQAALGGAQLPFSLHLRSCWACRTGHPVDKTLNRRNRTNFSIPALAHSVMDQIRMKRLLATY